MALHSQLNDEKTTACGMLISPLKTMINGPAPQLQDDDMQDIIDEALKVYRPNLLFKNFELQGPGDIFIIYQMIFITHCLRTIEKETQEDKAKLKLMEVCKDSIPNPNDNSYFMKGILKDAANNSELELYKGYLKQAREELCLRLLKIMFYNNNRSVDFKYWMGLSKKNFMNLKYKK